jgi:predicted methyltransferase
MRANTDSGWLGSKWLLAGATGLALLLGACAMQSTDKSSAGSATRFASGKAWKTDALAAALASPTRPQADRDRDADRKPAQLMTFFGVEPGMTAVDIIAAGGYMTDVLAVAVGPQGKVYAQNPPAFLKFREGANDKAITARLADNRLPNVVRVDADLPAATQISPGSVDVAVTAMNFHDVYNRDAALGQAFMKSVYTMLKPGGVFGVTDHVGLDGADNAKLHRIPRHIAEEQAKAAGFVIEAQSDVLAHGADDHTKVVFDPALRGKTDQFTLRLRKPR